MTLDCVGATLSSLHIKDIWCRSVQLYGASISAQFGQVEHGQGSLLMLKSPRRSDNVCFYPFYGSVS